MNRSESRSKFSAPVLRRPGDAEHAQDYGDYVAPLLGSRTFRRPPVGAGSAAAAFAFMLVSGTLVLAAGLAGLGHPTAARAAAGDNFSLVSVTRKTDDPLTHIIRAGIVSGDADVIVRFAPNTGPCRASKAIALAGGHVYRRLEPLDALAARVPRKNLARLAALPCVARLTSDAAVVSRNADLTTEHNDLVFPLSDTTIGE